MTTKSKIQIDPKRDAQLRRLAGRIVDDLFSIGDFHGDQMWMENDLRTLMATGRSKRQAESVIYLYLHHAELARLRSNKPARWRLSDEQRRLIAEIKRERTQKP